MPGPTPFQRKLLPAVLRAEAPHVLAQGSSGCGKSGAYLCAALLRCAAATPLTQVLVLAHTNAAVDSICATARMLLPPPPPPAAGQTPAVTVASGEEVLHGSSSSGQLQAPPHILVCLPSHLARLTAGSGGQGGSSLGGTLPLPWQALSLVVLDEADLLLSHAESAGTLQRFQATHCPTAQLLLVASSYAGLRPHFPLRRGGGAGSSPGKPWVCGGQDAAPSAAGQQQQQRPFTGLLCRARNSPAATACHACGFPADGIPAGPLHGCTGSHASEGGEPYCAHFPITPAIAEQRRNLALLLGLYFAEHHRPAAAAASGAAAAVPSSTLLHPVYQRGASSSSRATVVVHCSAEEAQSHPAAAAAAAAAAATAASPGGAVGAAAASAGTVQHLLADFTPPLTSPSDSCFVSKVHLLSRLLFNFSTEHACHLKTLVLCSDSDTAIRLTHALRQRMPFFSAAVPAGYKVLWGTREFKALEVGGDWRGGQLLPVEATWGSTAYGADSSSSSSAAEAVAAQRRAQRAHLAEFCAPETRGAVLVGTYGTLARALDAKGLDAVVLWDMPVGRGGVDLEAYLHALGRVGRAAQGARFPNQLVLHMVGDTAVTPGEAGRGDCRASAEAQAQAFALLTELAGVGVRGGVPLYQALRLSERNESLAGLSGEVMQALTEEVGWGGRGVGEGEGEGEREAPRRPVQQAGREEEVELEEGGGRGYY